MTTSQDKLQVVLESSVLVYVRAETMSAQRSLDTNKETDTNFRQVKRLQEVIDPKWLSPFHRLRASATRACRARGTQVSVLGGWLVPQAEEEELLKELAELKRQWDEVELAKLRANYDGWVLEQSLSARTSEEADAVLKLAPPVASAVRSTSFAIAVVKLRAEDLAVDADQTFDALVERVFADFSTEIREARLLDPSFYTSAARSHIGRIARKAGSLHYLHPRLDETAKRARQLLEALPDVKRFEGPDALAIRAFMAALSQPEKLLSNGFGPSSAVNPPAVGAGVPHRPEQRKVPGGANASIPEERVQEDGPITEQASWAW
jgi:hypothetical protein